MSVGPPALCWDGAGWDGEGGSQDGNVPTAPAVQGSGAGDPPRPGAGPCTQTGVCGRGRTGSGAGTAWQGLVLPRHPPGGVALGAVTRVPPVGCGSVGVRRWLGSSVGLVGAQESINVPLVPSPMTCCRGGDGTGDRDTFSTGVSPHGVVGSQQACVGCWSLRTGPAGGGTSIPGASGRPGASSCPTACQQPWAVPRTCRGRHRAGSQRGGREEGCCEAFLSSGERL